MDDKPDEPRENLIITAVNFLTNPNVQRSTLQQKQRFLRNKGLTDQEVQIACERAGVFGVKESNEKHTIINMDRSQQTSSVHVYNRPLSTFDRVKEILNSVAVFSGVAYLVFKFYKRFIEPWLFGDRERKKKNLEQKVDAFSEKVEKDLKLIGQEVSRIRDEVSQFDVRREMQSFKSDLESIKGLLLSKKQFASPNLPIVPPSIPSWQLKTRHDSENEKHLDDAGSGSGSSETEVVTKNSDSSLEMM